MSFFSDILQKLKKPVDALKDFLTPKEKKSMEFKVGEGLTPEQRVKAEAVLKKPAPDKLAYVPELGYAPYKSPTREMIAQMFGEGPRTSTIPEASKKVGSAILQFGKDILRAGPRAAASATLEAQGRKKMIPETKAERFLFGEEPLESITERIERFPERAKEFGISEPTSKKIAPFAVIGLTALDILPPLPGKAGLKGVAKKALTAKTAREFAKTITEKEAGQILKAGFKTVDDFFKVTKKPAAKASLKIVDELKAVASTKKEFESLVNPLVEAKTQGYKVTNISNTQLGKQKGFAYRIEKGMDKMYAKNESEIADLIKPGSRAIPTKPQSITEAEIPKAIMDEAQSAKDFALSKINDKEWMSGASKVSQDMVLDNSRKSVQQIAKEKFDYLKYRAGMVDKDGYPLDKAAKNKLAEVTKSSIPKELESFIPQAQKHKDVSSFIKEIAGDTYAPEFRNPIADFWRKKYFQPLSKESKATFTTDVVAFERNLDDVLKSKYAKDQLANMSVRQKAEIVNGKKWTDKYAEMLDNNLFKFQNEFFKTAKATAPAQVKPTAVLKDAAAQGVHSKKLEAGIDDAYKALDKAGQDEVYTLGKVGDFITDKKVREQYKDVLDTPLYVKKQMHMGKAHGSLSVDPKGNAAIVLSDGLTADMIDRTLVEELTHARQFKKGIRPTASVPYKEIPEEIRAKKAAKYFAPKATLEDVIEAGVPAKPTDELKKILYHGTDFENVPKIQKQGFKVGGFLVHGYPQGVYFTTTKREAENYGRVIQSSTNLKLSEFFDVSKHKELNKLSGDKYIQKLNQIIRETAESKGVAVPKPTTKQLKQYRDLVSKELKDPLDISDIKTTTLQKLGYKGFVAAEKGIGKEIVIFDPKDIIVGGKPKPLGTINLRSEALKAKSERDFMDRFAVEPRPEDIKNLKVDISKFKPYEKPHDYVNIKDLDPSEYDSWDELRVFDSQERGIGTKGLDENIKFLKENPTKDLPSVLLEGTIDNKEFRPMVTDGHHRVVAYIEAGREKIPISYDRRTLKEIYSNAQKTKTGEVSKPTEALKAALKKTPTVKESAKSISQLENESAVAELKSKFKNTEGREIIESAKKEILAGKKYPLVLEKITEGKNAGKYKVIDGNYRAQAYKELGIKEAPAITQSTVPIFEQGKPVTTSVVRQAQKGFENTDKFRGGTWYSTPESKNFDFSGTGPKAERGVGGPKKIEATLEIKKPFVIDDAIPEDGSFGVINSGYENVLPPKHRKLGNELYERVFGEHGLTSQELGVKEMKWANEDVLIDVGKKLGLTEARAKAVAQSTNGFDAMMDLVISDGLRQKGYDALILENRIKSGDVVDRHIFKFAEAEKVKPTAELKEILKGKPAAPAKAQEVISEYQKRIDTTPAKKAATPISKTLDDTYTAIIDRFHPITKLARKASELRPGENPELLARRYLGVQGIAESKLFWNTTRLTAEGNLEVTGPGLSKILRPAKNNIDDLRTLMIAERDIELSKRTLESGKEVIGTTPQKSKEVINALKQKFGAQGYDQLSKTAQGVREWSRKALLDPLLEVGAISKEQYDTITKSNEFYVPFQRVIEELETHGFVPKKTNIFSPKSVPVKKLKGSTKDIIDPFESLITNAYKVTDFVERARVGRSIANLRSVSPELADMIKPIKPKIVPVAKQGEELIYRPSFFTPEKNTMMVFENGKRKFYQVPEDVYKAVSGMMESDVGAIMKMLAFPARTLRAGATLTPEFIGRNPLRDQFTAFVFSKYGYVPGVDLARGVFNTIGKTDLYGRWLAGGGAQSMLVSLDRVTSQATLSKVLGAKDIKGMVKNPLEALRILSELGEKGTRLGAFGKAVKKGVSDLEAAFESRDLTLDFARRGSQTRAVNMMVAFWNAQVQGLNKMVRTFRERPMQTTFKAVSGITLPSVLLYLNNRNNPRYQELPQWQKDLFWVVPVGDKGPIIRIPKPFEVGVIFGTVPEHILTWIDKNDPEALTSAAKTFMEASAPGYIPTGLQPIIENVANYSFFRQRSIVSEGQQALPKEMQAGRYTSETAKELGKLIKQSPAKIENLFVGYTAGLGQYALDASDKLLKTLGVVSPPSGPAKTLSDYPFIKAFVAREPIGSGSASVDKFYKIYDEANATKAAVKGLAEEGKDQDAVTYLRSHPAGFYTKGLNKVARAFSDLRKKRDAVLDSRDLNPEQKKRAVDALDKIMTEIARQTVELVESSNEKFRQ